MATMTPSSPDARLWAPGEAWAAYEACLPATRRLLLYGPPGTGKTHQATLLGAVEGEQTFSMTMTPQTPASACWGHFVPKPSERGGTDLVWLDGPALAAWRASHNGPTRLVINEIDRAGPDASAALHVLLDDLKTARVTLPTGETVTPGRYGKIIATMNGEPEDLDDPVRDRFPVKFRIDDVHPGALMMLPEWLRPLARDSVAVTDPTRRTSVRVWLALAELLAKGVPEGVAAKATFGARHADVVAAMAVAKAAAALPTVGAPARARR